MSSRTKRKKNCIKIIVAFSLNSYVGHSNILKHFDSNTTGTQRRLQRRWKHGLIWRQQLHQQEGNSNNSRLERKYRATRYSTKRWKLLAVEVKTGKSTSYEIESTDFCKEHRIVYDVQFSRCRNAFFILRFCAFMKLFKQLYLAADNLAIWQHLSMIRCQKIDKKSCIDYD